MGVGVRTRCRKAAASLSIVAALAHSAAATAAGERLTQHCNTNYGNGEMRLVAPPAVRRTLIDIANNPAANPDVYHRLWRPESGRETTYRTFENEVILEVGRVQDSAEIQQSIRADPVLASMGVTGAWADTEEVCFAALPPPAVVQITEFFHPGLDHYFLSSSDQETRAIESGSAGAEWQRTGESFRAIEAGYCYGSRPVFRFYGARRNSHFFTVDAAECGLVRRVDPGWRFEGVAFGATLPVDRACKRGVPVFRLYNNRAAQDDANHRFTVKTSIRDEMVARGWIFEGIAMCLNPDWTIP